MPHAFDRRSFLAGGVALGAGMVALGSSSEWAGASLTNGPGRNGISTAKPKRGGSITFGIDTEEGGFDPTSARWDEGGFLYGRTVFDPLAIVTTTGQVQPYLAQSITSNPDYTVFTIVLRSGINFHDGTPLNAAALELNLQKQQASILTGSAFANVESIQVTGPLTVAITMKTPWEELPLLPRPGPDGLHRGALHAQRTRRRDDTAGGHGALRVRGVDTQQPLHRHGQSALLAPGAPLPQLDHLQADHRPRVPGRRPRIGHHRHHAHQHAADLRDVPPQQEVVLRRRQRGHPRPARGELHHAQHRRRSLQQPQAAQGPGHGEQFRPSTPRSSTSASTRR